MQIKIAEHLITATITWLTRIEAVIILEPITQAAIASHIKDGTNEGYVLQGGYKILWKCIS